MSMMMMVMINGKEHDCNGDVWWWLCCMKMLMMMSMAMHMGDE